MGATKDRFLNDILDREGPYSNDPADSGGETAWGITAEVARADGYQGAMRELPRIRAYSILERLYWAPLRLDEVEAVAPAVAAELADSGVNCGIGTAGKWLQLALNALNNQGTMYPDVAVDGQVGTATIGALRAYLRGRGPEGAVVLLAALNGLQAAYYIDLSQRRPKDERFVYGWLRSRVVAA